MNQEQKIIELLRQHANDTNLIVDLMTENVQLREASESAAVRLQVFKSYMPADRKAILEEYDDEIEKLRQLSKAV